MRFNKHRSAPYLFCVRLPVEVDKKVEKSLKSTVANDGTVRLTHGQIFANGNNFRKQSLFFLFKPVIRCRNGDLTIKEQKFDGSRLYALWII